MSQRNARAFSAPVEHPPTPLSSHADRDELLKFKECPATMSTGSTPHVDEQNRLWEEKRPANLFHEGIGTPRPHRAKRSFDRQNGLVTPTATPQSRQAYRPVEGEHRRNRVSSIHPATAGVPSDPESPLSSPGSLPSFATPPPPPGTIENPLQLITPPKESGIDSTRTSVTPCQRVTPCLHEPNSTVDVDSEASTEDWGWMDYAPGCRTSYINLPGAEDFNYPPLSSGGLSDSDCASPLPRGEVGIPGIKALAKTVRAKKKATSPRTKKNKGQQKKPVSQVT